MGFLSSFFGGASSRQLQEEEEGGAPLQPLTPCNELEEALARCRDDASAIQPFTALFVQAKVYLPLLSEPETLANGGNISPVIIEGPEGRFIPVFTTPERAGTLPQIGVQERSGLLVETQWVLRVMAPDLGLYVNPNWSASIIMPPDSIRQIRETFHLQ